MVDDKQGAAKREVRQGRNPIVGETAADTIANCCDSLEWLVANGEDLPRGLRLNHLALLDALGTLCEGRAEGS